MGGTGEPEAREESCERLSPGLHDCQTRVWKQLWVPARDEASQHLNREQEWSVSYRQSMAAGEGRIIHFFVVCPLVGCPCAEEWSDILCV